MKRSFLQLFFMALLMTAFTATYAHNGPPDKKKDPVKNGSLLLPATNEQSAITKATDGDRVSNIQGGVNFSPGISFAANVTTAGKMYAADKTVKANLVVPLTNTTNNAFAEKSNRQGDIIITSSPPTKFNTVSTILTTPAAYNYG